MPKYVCSVRLFSPLNWGKHLFPANIVKTSTSHFSITSFVSKSRLSTVSLSVKMKKYRILLEGKNFLINSDEGPNRMGFYTTRYVEAENREDAEKRSVELIKNDPKLKDVMLNIRSDPPMIYLEKIEEISSFDGVDKTNTGYTFYPEESKQ